MRSSDWSSDVCSSDLLRKQEPREACASPGTLGSCLRRNTDPSRAAPPSSSGPAPLPRERINLRRNKGQLSPPQGDIIGVSLAFAERRFYQAPSSPSGTGKFLPRWRSEEHTSELQSLMRISYAVFCLNKKNT